MIYRCDSEAVDADFSNPTVQDDVRKYITTYEKGKIEDYFNTRAAQLQRRADTVGLDKAAAREMQLSAAARSRSRSNLSNVFSFAPLRAVPDTATPTNAAYSEDFFYRAFSLGKDQVSAPIVLDDQVVVLKLKSEEQLPDSTSTLLDVGSPMSANQSVQTDLGAVLMTPDKLKDNFVDAFTQIYGPMRRDHEAVGRASGRMECRLQWRTREARSSCRPDTGAHPSMEGRRFLPWNGPV